jgi:hypothetical protein
MTADHEEMQSVLDAMVVAHWPVLLPVDAAVLVPSRLAQLAMRTYPLRGGRLGLPVIVVGRMLFRLTFAWDGAWWVLRLPYSVGAVYWVHGHRFLPVVVRGRLGVECLVCGWETGATVADVRVLAEGSARHISAAAGAV